MAKKKNDLERMSVTIDHSLLEAFDKTIAERGYATRSEAVNALIRDSLIRREMARPEARAAGAVVLVYRHRDRELSKKLTGRQHETHHHVIATMHVHLDADRCLEIIALRGRAGDIRRTADELMSLKGVAHGRFIETAAGEIV